MKMFHFVLHILAMGNFAYAIYFDLYMVDNMPGRTSFGGQWKYLTFINMWIQLVYFSICLLNALVGSGDASKMSDRSQLQKVRDFMFATVAFPIGQFVGIVFWTLFAIDRDLVFPEFLDEFIPPAINHMMHTTVMPAQLLELVLFHHHYPNKKAGMATTITFCFVYLAWTLIVAYVDNVWVYPIFAVLDPVQRGLFMIVCSAFGGLIYVAGEHLNRLVWSNSQEDGSSGDFKAKKAN